MSQPIRVLVVDDHPVVRTGVQGMLASNPDFDVVGEACDGEEALSQVEALNPDVVLMDLRMPAVDGVEATRRIRVKHPGVQVLVLTTYDTDEDILRAVEAGAVGYLLKDAPREELFRGVHAAARGESQLAAAVASRLMGRIRTPASQSLSPRELEVLMLVATEDRARTSRERSTSARPRSRLTWPTSSPSSESTTERRRSPLPSTEASSG